MQYIFCSNVVLKHNILLDVDNSLWSQWSVEIKEAYVNNNWESLPLERIEELTGNSEFVDSIKVDSRSMISSVENVQHAVRATTFNLSALKSRVTKIEEGVDTGVADIKREISEMKSQINQIISMLGEKDNFEPPKKKTKIMKRHVFDWTTVLEKFDSSQLGHYLYIWHDFDAQESYNQKKGIKKERSVETKYFRINKTVKAIQEFVDNPDDLKKPSDSNEYLNWKKFMVELSWKCADLAFTALLEKGVIKQKFKSINDMKVSSFLEATKQAAKLKT